jgi:hypothetical protein
MSQVQLTALGLDIEAAHYDVRRGLLWRGELATAMPFEDNGGLFELRAGVEWQPRACGVICAYGGVDLAYVWANTTDSPESWTANGALVIPRGGSISAGVTRGFSSAPRFRSGWAPSNRTCRTCVRPSTRAAHSS